MKAIWMALAALALAGAISLPAAAQRAQTFPFACEFEIDLLTDRDLERANVPDEVIGKGLLETGEKRCTFSNNPVTQIRCEQTVDGWEDPPQSLNIRTFRDGARCQWFLEENECGFDGLVEATNQSFIIERVDDDTARLRLICSSRIPPG